MIELELRKGAKNNVLAIIIATFVLVINVFFVDFMSVSGKYMEKSFESADIVLINKNIKNISRYDVIVANTNEKWIKGKVIKRVIGLPNETLQIISGYVYINGEKLRDDVVDYPMEYVGIAVTKITLSDYEYFLLGDNRNESQDSRYEWLGVINKNQIIGKVLKKISLRIN